MCSAADHKFDCNLSVAHYNSSFSASDADLAREISHDLTATLPKFGISSS